MFLLSNTAEGNMSLDSIGQNLLHALMWEQHDYKVSDKNITNKSEIEIGLRDSGYVEVLAGLNEGDIIVAEGLKKVRPKGKIKPIKK